MKGVLTLPSDRARVWALCVYPDSLPENWLQMLDDMHIPAFVSPLHDRDVNADSTPKKPHYHILLQYDGVKSFEQVRAEVAEPLHGTIPIRIQSVRAYARYLIHLDNPEKVQYNREDIRCFGGVDWDKMAEQTAAMRHANLRAMRSYIRSHDIFSFAAFYDYCDENKPEWAAMLDDNSTMSISNYIKSRVYDKRDKEKRDILAQERALQEVRIQNEHLRMDKLLESMDPFK